MSHADYLRELLRPLRVYELTGTANGGELEAVGEALFLVVHLVAPEAEAAVEEGEVEVLQKKKLKTLN